MKNLPWTVHKFGGTSVGNAERYLNVTKIIAEFPRDRAIGIVVSAMKGVTDSLIQLVELARKRDESYRVRLETLKSLHLVTVDQLVQSPEIRDRLKTRLVADFTDIQEILRGLWLIRSASEKFAETVSGYGEVWSAQFLQAALEESGRSCRWLDARDVLVVDPLEHSVSVDWECSDKKLQEWLRNHPCELLVITGFVASTREGVATTLKRNGSDFSASIFGSLLNAQEVVIWTDVDGVMSADPRLVPEAIVLDEMSYHEVTELAYFGAKVVHPATMEPAIHKGIPVWIKNTFNPKFPGTKIHRDARSERPIKGFSTIDKMTLINIEGTGMVGVPGVAERLFSALRTASVSVVMISQASSEHSICFAVPQSQAELAKSVVEKSFYAEIHQGLISPPELSPDCSILAVVGDNMASQPGVAGKFFSALGKAGVNIRAIAQGASERNISAVIASQDAMRALRTVHSSFYLSDQTLSVGIIGTGLIGKALLRQLDQQLESLRKEHRIDIRIRGIMNSKRMILDDRSIPLACWQERLDGSSDPASIEKFVEHVLSGNLPHSVVIDATASAEVAELYPDWLSQGLHVITPNKKANTASFSNYRKIRGTARGNSRHFLYSTNVGAGLPIIQTLRDLHFTGDQFIQIEGILSGTLSYIFNSFTGDEPFSMIVKNAKERGYTEPDPRDDLSGMDVARKLVILAREAGLPIELDQVKVQSLVPETLRAGTPEQYLERLHEFDDEMSALHAQAQKKDLVLRYVGTIDRDGNAQVELRSFPRTHPFARIRGSDNIVGFRTRRYDSQPLFIQGPGAGPEVTAAGVFADLLRLASYLGPRQ